MYYVYVTNIGEDLKERYEVGYYLGQANSYDWNVESIHLSAEAAAARINYLNGGTGISHNDQCEAHAEALRVLQASRDLQAKVMAEINQ